MKRLIVLAFLVLISYSACYEYSDGEDDFAEPSDDYIPDEEEDVKPQIYDLKDSSKLFKKFLKDYNKVYKTDAEYNEHYKNFVKNLKYINDVNKEGGSASLDINNFTDLSDKELGVLSGSA